MTDNDALDLIKAMMGGEDTDERNVRARVALTGAINVFNLLGEFWWNEQQADMTLTSGSSSWALSDLTDYDVRTVFDEYLWFSSTKDRIEIIDRTEFNAKRRGQTTTGRPQYACIHSKDATLEVYPTPDANYTVWTMVGVRVRNLSDLPDELHLPVIWLAVMSATPADNPNNINAARLWSLAEEKILNTRSRTAWKGSQIESDDAIGSSHATIGVSSYNPLGEI